MDKLGYLESFLSVLDQGSLSAAGRVQNLSQPAISQQMTALERLYGVPLLQRSSTGVTPTREGGIVARHAKDLISGHRQMLAEITALRTLPQGDLRVSLNQFMAQSVVGDNIQALRKSFPELQVTIKVEDRTVDVVREGYDLALRTGSPGDSDGIVRKIGRLQSVLVAAPDYLAQAGPVETPDDLVKLGHIQYAEHRSFGVMQLLRDGRECEAEIVNSMVVDTPQHMMNAVAQGYGFCRMPLSLAQGMLQNGTVHRLLPEYQVEPKPIYLVYPHRHALTRSLRVVIRAILDGLSQFDGVELSAHPDLQRDA